MQAIYVKSAPARHLRRSDFGAAYDRGTHTVMVPAEVGDIIKHFSVRTLAEMLSVLDNFPSFFARALKWDVSEVYAARKGLEDRLRGVLPEEVTSEKRVAFSRGFGALPPEEDD